MKLPLRQLMSFQVRSFLPAPAGAALAAASATPSSPSVSSAGPAGGESLRGPFAREQVRVRLSPRFNRRRHADAQLEASVDATWEAYRREAPRLFNAAKFRLHQWRAARGLGGDGLVMDWGLTDYKTYLGTCCAAIAPRLLRDGAVHAADDEAEIFAFLSRKVGVAAVGETSDAHVALIKRSAAVGLYQNLHDTPGGHPEPSNIGLTWEALEELEGHHEQQRALEDAARDELFQSIVNEVHEEINISPADLSAPLLLGVVLQTDACTPSFSFYMRTTHSADEVQALYRAGPMDKFESQQLDLLDAQALLSHGSSASPLDRLELTPSARGTLALWQEFKRLEQQETD